MHFDTLKGWLAWQEGFHSQVIDLGLERVNAVYERLLPDGNPLPTLTVAGTNGKGSCIALLASIYQAAGYRVGAYTSPHILAYNERICIDGIPVADEAICAAFERIEACRDEVSLSYFEFSTLAALDIFARQKVDVQLLEVGLGGRLDAVNMVDADVAIISTIGIDHAEWLGDTREAIAIEKAGIFRAGMPAVIGDPDPPLTLLQQAELCGAEYLAVGQAYDFEVDSANWTWQGVNQRFADLPLPALKGQHQFLNAAAVLAAIEQMQGRLPVPTRAIHLGLLNVRLQGRFQLINAPIPVLLDVGHNPQAVKTLHDYVSQHFPDKRLRAIFAIMKDKDIHGVLEIMRPLVHDWTLAPLQNPRAATTEQLRTIFETCGITQVVGDFADFKSAFNFAFSKAQAGDLLVVFGSFFLVSAYLAAYGNGSETVSSSF